MSTGDRALCTAITCVACGSQQSHRVTDTRQEFLQTWQLLEDPNNTHLISWTPDGDAFVVLQPDTFARELLPTVFKHNNYTSFVRQLNIYVRC